MFLSFIPAWFACCLLYGSSSKQRFFKSSLPKAPARIISLVLVVCMLLILNHYLPNIAAIITGVALICCFLPLVTLIAAYKRFYLGLSSVVICLLPLVFFWIGGNT